MVRRSAYSMARRLRQAAWNQDELDAGVGIAVYGAVAFGVGWTPLWVAAVGISVGLAKIVGASGLRTAGARVAFLRAVLPIGALMFWLWEAVMAVQRGGAGATVAWVIATFCAMRAWRSWKAHARLLAIYEQVRSRRDEV